jgi:hypothetical protein
MVSTPLLDTSLHHFTIFGTVTVHQLVTMSWQPTIYEGSHLFEVWGKLRKTVVKPYSQK